MFNVSYQYSLLKCVSLPMYCSTNLTHSPWFSTYMQVIEHNPKKQKQRQQYQYPCKMKWCKCEQTKQTKTKEGWWRLSRNKQNKQNKPKQKKDGGDWAGLIRIRNKLENVWLNFKRPLAQLLASFLLKARCHFLNTPLWHVRDIVISSICLQVTVGCTNIAFLHLSEM